MYGSADASIGLVPIAQGGMDVCDMKGTCRQRASVPGLKNWPGAELWLEQILTLCV